MNNEEKKLKLLKPENFGEKDPKNPKNIDVERILEEARKKRAKEFADKKIIVNGKEKK